MAIRIKDFQSVIPSDFKEYFEGDGVPDALEYAIVDPGEKAIDTENRSVTFVASDDSIDMDDEIIAGGAFHERIGIYNANPVLLASHRHSTNTGASSVVGSVRNLVTDKNPVVGVAVFGQNGAGNDHWELYRDRHQRAFSVGFRVLDTERKDGRLIITKGLLLEISAVAVPANSNALVLEFVRGRMAGIAERLVREGRDSASGQLDEVVCALQEINERCCKLLGEPSPTKDDNGDHYHKALDEDEDQQLAELIDSIGAEGA